MNIKPFYDPKLSYEANYAEGPFGAFADGVTWRPSRPPQFKFLGLAVDIPFGIPAGPLLNGRFVQAALDKGFSIATYKTVRSRAYQSHPWPNVLSVKVTGDLTPEKAKHPLVADTHYAQPLSITNSFGVPSKDPTIWQQDLSDVLTAVKSGQVVVGSFQGTIGPHGVDEFIKDWVTTAKLMTETGVKLVELNLSCPNEGSNHLVCFDVERTAAIVAAVRSVMTVPMIIKIAYFSEQDQLKSLVKKVGPMVEGISAINTIPATVVTESGEQALPGQGRAVSGVCGHAIQWAGLHMVHRLVELRQKLKQEFAVIGVGGVTEVSDFERYRQAGADAVMSATGAMWNPLLAQEIYQKGNT